MAALDIYAMPSVEEALGAAYFEAMAMRKPVVALASGGVPEIITDGDAGFLVPPGAVDVLAERLERLIEDRDLRQAMGTRGRQRIDTFLNARRMATDAERVYAELVSRPSHGRERGRRGGRRAGL
jgi:glycosyltransferase involved in cell wall biosynthesis